MISNVKLVLFGVIGLIWRGSAYRCQKVHQPKLLQHPTALNLRDRDDNDLLLSPDDDLKPKFGVKSLDEITDRRQVESRGTSRPRPTTPDEIRAESSLEQKGRYSKVFNKVNFDDLYERSGGKSKRDIRNVKKEDLNGIEPYKPFLFAILPGLFCLVGFEVSKYLAGHFVVAFVDSDLYPVQRIAIVSRNLIVGIVTLASGFSGVVSLGLFCMGVAVTLGVVKGELDPKKKDNEDDKD